MNTIENIANPEQHTQKRKPLREALAHSTKGLKEGGLVGAIIGGTLATAAVAADLIIGDVFFVSKAIESVGGAGIFIPEFMVMHSVGHGGYDAVLHAKDKFHECVEHNKSLDGIAHEHSPTIEHSGKSHELAHEQTLEQTLEQATPSPTTSKTVQQIIHSKKSEISAENWQDKLIAKAHQPDQNHGQSLL